MPKPCPHRNGAVGRLKAARPVQGAWTWFRSACRCTRAQSRIRVQPPSVLDPAAAARYSGRESILGRRGRLSSCVYALLLPSTNSLLSATCTCPELVGLLARCNRRTKPSLNRTLFGILLAAGRLWLSAHSSP